jgi:hypothetical protein
MVSILIVALCALLLGLSLRRTPDSREHVPSEEERFAAYGLSWGTREDLEDQEALARELRASLTQIRAARQASDWQVSGDWGDRLAA